MRKSKLSETANSKSFTTSPANFEEFLAEAARLYQNATALSIYQQHGWQTLSYVELESRAKQVAAQLSAAGLKPQARAAILADPSIDWIVHFFAIQLCGAVAIPLDTKLVEAELYNVLTHAEPFLILTSRDYRVAASKLKLRLTNPAKSIVIEDTESYALLIEQPFIPQSSPRDSLALICYTSGTSGAPKGVEIRVESCLFEAEALYSVSGELGEKEVMLSILPLNHLFGLTAGVIYCLRSEIEHCILHSLTPQAIQQCLNERAVTTVLAVPLYVRMLMRGIRRKILDERGKSADRIFRALLKSTKALPIASYRSLVGGAIQSQMGGKLRKFICGGASLDPAVYDFFKAVGIPVYIGYGLTETGPVIAVNTETHQKGNSVGKPLPGVEVKILKTETKTKTKSGEILTRGPHLMRGYFKSPDLTHEAMTEDGWFCTGDLGWIDKDNYLFVRGRKKALIVLSSGKKVYPEEVESVLAKSSSVKTVCVVGLTDPTNMMAESITAVILPTDEDLQNYGLDPSVHRTRLLPHLQKLCLELSSFKRPVRFIFRTQPFVMTTSMKVKRDILIEELQADAASDKK